ncbi:response regulator transcription factor [Paralimibaculum aggregatum]|uniref:Response regulator transcription factor n=1 Tax=Paralimibaculum aggregatum TaxID=3036245 RepID=A0ABQ6LRP1_9RHOB|nr:response regulator transcription factor [Limibaculum sp. NKW23]GMG83905.1 response regulator transcription factor [Limibaculum sp. NKW23]
MRVLLVDDEADLAEQVRAALEDAGITVDLAGDGEDAQHLGATECYACIVLDLGLPRLDGVSVLRSWRAEGIATPVLILTARSSWQQRVEGLNAGGDDYLTKPFHIEELIARIRALVRRSAGAADPVLRAGDIELDTVAMSVRAAGLPVSLTAHELKVLLTLMLQPGQVHGKADLAAAVYGYFEERDSNTIEAFVGRLRRKLGAGAIETVRGLGYRIASG